MTRPGNNILFHMGGYERQDEQVVRVSLAADACPEPGQTGTRPVLAGTVSARMVGGVPFGGCGCIDRTRHGSANMADLWTLASIPFYQDTYRLYVFAETSLSGHTRLPAG